MECEYAALEMRTLNNIRGNQWIKPLDTLVVAVSGGADSMALLMLLSRLSSVLSISLHIAHFEHGIRGQESLEDAAFVRDTAASFGIPFHVEHGHVLESMREKGLSMEEAARDARYGFLTRVRKKVSARYVVLGHHQEDQAETLMLHLIHGAGLAGLSAMRIVSGDRFRPFLAEPLSEIQRYVAEKHIDYRLDRSNQDASHARNFLRIEVFPLLRKLNPRVAEAMARTANIAQGAADTLQAQAKEQLAGRMKRTPYGAFCMPKGWVLSADAWMVFLRFAGVPPLSMRMLETLMRKESVMLSGGYTAVFSRSRMHLVATERQPPQIVEADFRYEPCNANETSSKTSQVFDAEKLHGAVFRYRLSGDLFRTLYGKGTQKLKQTLIDAHIDQPFRDYVPCLCFGKQVLWIVGVKMGDDAKVTEHTHDCVRITYLKKMIWDIDFEEEPA